MQLTHDHYTPERSHRKIILACDHVSSPANQGALFRLADAFLVDQILFCGAVDISSSRLKRTARSTQQSVTYEALDDHHFLEKIKDLVPTSYIMSLEITNDSIALSSVQLPKDSDVVLIIGKENTGVRPELLSISNCIAHIPMFGTNSSMNVAQATGIALYTLRS